MMDGQYVTGLGVMRMAAPYALPAGRVLDCLGDLRPVWWVWVDRVSVHVILFNQKPLGLSDRGD